METPQAVGRVFNIGSDQPIAILELARRVIDAVDPKLPIVHQSYAEAYSEDFEDCRCRVPDLGRLREAIGFQPALHAGRRHPRGDRVEAWKRRSLAPAARPGSSPRGRGG